MRKLKKVGLICSFHEGSADGQTIKILELKNYLENRYGKNEIAIVNSYGCKGNSVISYILKVAKCMKSSENIILIFSYKGFTKILPLVLLLNVFNGRKLLDLVVGGNRHKRLKKNLLMRCLNRKVDVSFVEIASMMNEYEKMGIKSAYVPNFKKLYISKQNKNTEKGPGLKTCLFSRVCMEKGVEDAINAVVKMNELNYRVSLDIYGKIDASYIAAFEKIRAALPEYITYKGVVEYWKSTSVIEAYDYLLFPTLYDSEGFPGTVIDAFCAGVPVIATDNSYNKEIIEDGVTGFVYTRQDDDSLFHRLQKVYSFKDYAEMRASCLNEARKYLPDAALEPLIEAIGE